jgi:predicted enzyme related to lactoylglutathione lyase
MDARAQPDRLRRARREERRRLRETKAFFETAFGWTYQDYGPDYCDTKSSGVGSGINGGSDHRTLQPLPVIYVEDLEAAQGKVVDAGGIVTRAIFSFPAAAASSSPTRPATSWVWSASVRTEVAHPGRYAP